MYFFLCVCVCVSIEDKILCLHGGIGASVTSLDQLSALQKPIDYPDEIKTESDHVIVDVLWSDPTESDRVVGIHANSRGHNIVTFGPDRVKDFCERNGIDLIIRAHQCVEGEH